MQPSSSTLPSPQPALSAEDQTARRVHEKLRRELGPLVGNAITEPGVIEVVLNPDGRVWVERLGKDMEAVGVMPPRQAEAMFGTVAAILGRTISAERPVLECELPIDGSRFTALLPPIVRAPSFTIRRPASKVYTLDDYVAQGGMTARQVEHIRQAIRRHDNILVVGGTSSGKTTFGNALIEAMVRAYPNRRRVIIQDTAELRCGAENVVQLFSTVDITMTQLLRVTMRMRPDSIDVGEVRGAEAHALLKAWNTGHPGGFATVHANDARAGLVRIEQLVLEATQAPMQQLIAAAINLVVVMAKTPKGRRVTEILSVKGLRDGEYVVVNLE